MEKLIIYHSNDMHNRTGVLDLLEGMKREENSLLLDAGDALAGSNTLFRLSEPILGRMKKLGYDAMAMGNREFNYLRSVIKKRTEEAGFPILCANLLDLKEIVRNCYKPYIIKSVGTLRIGIFGLTVVQYTHDSLWLPIMKFRFLDPMETACTMIDELMKKTDMIILLSHLGKDMDIMLGEQSPGLNLIIGGHSHTPIEEPIMANGIPVVQAGCFGNSLGRMEITVDKGSRIDINSMKYKLIKTGSRH